MDRGLSTLHVNTFTLLAALAVILLGGVCRILGLQKQLLLTHPWLVLARLDGVRCESAVSGQVLMLPTQV